MPENAVDLTGKRIVVAGGTGDVGEGVVRALFAAGASVIVPTRSAEKGARLRDALANPSLLELIAGEVGHVRGAMALAATIAASCPLDGLVASLGGWWSGPMLVELDHQAWDRVIADNLTSHFALARAFAPLLKETQGTYIQLVGGAAEYPAPGSSLVSITASAVAMMGRTIEAETNGAFVTRQIMIGALVATRSRAAGPDTGVSADEIGALAARLIARPDVEGLVRRLPVTTVPSETGESV